MKKLILFAAFFSVSHAWGADCEFFAKEKMPQLFSEMPAETRGMVNCYPGNQDANVFVVSKLADLTETSFAAYIQNFARMIDLGSTTVAIEWQSNQPLAHRQAIVKTASTGKPAMQHFVFVSRGLVFIHSMDERESRRIKKSLDDLYLKISAMTI